MNAAYNALWTSPIGNPTHSVYDGNGGKRAIMSNCKDQGEKHYCVPRVKDLIGTLILLTVVILLSACVSDTLSTVDTQPLAEDVSYDPVQREQAVAEMREKASQPGSGELTNAFADPDGPNEAMNELDQAARIIELEYSANQNATNVTDEEMAEKQRSIRELQQKARSHYQNAVESIQN